MTSPIGPLRPRGRSHADRFRRKKPAELSDFPPVSAVGVEALATNVTRRPHIPSKIAGWQYPAILALRSAVRQK
jgi:hypothetical protein